MNISSLSLTNFRNFSSKKIIFGEKLTVIIGPNGSGKSNILEAAAILASQRPARVETDLDLIKFGQSETKIEGKVADGAATNILTINFQVIDETYIKKAYFLNSLKKRLIDFVQHISVVVFHPQDLELVTGSPAVRRHHLDTVLASCDREYWRSIGAYNKIVVRRNKVLQRIAEGKSKIAELDFWDGRLLEHARYISKGRDEFFEFLNKSQGENTSDGGRLNPPAGGESHDSFEVNRLRSGVSLGDFSWQLKQSLLSEEKLARNKERDIVAGMTLSGPHRDDFAFYYDKQNLEFFGSRGEQRMAVLALKLFELEYLAVKRGMRPVLALDDIFSELDWEHREAVLSVIDKQQTIVTAAEADSVPKKILKKAKVVELE